MSLLSKEIALALRASAELMANKPQGLDEEPYLDFYRPAASELTEVYSTVPSTTEAVWLADSTLWQSELPSNDADKHLRFLDLPAEIRNSIYEYLFEGSRTSIRKMTHRFQKHLLSRAFHITHQSAPLLSRAFYITHQSAPRVKARSGMTVDGPIYKGMPAILATNKQIRQEALAIFYSTTTWTSNACENFVVLLRRLAPDEAWQMDMAALYESYRYEWLRKYFRQGFAERLSEALTQHGVRLEPGLVKVEVEKITEGWVWERPVN